MTAVLLVEHDPAIAGPLMRALSREGYEVTVSHGHDAVAAAAGVDLIVLDSSLPDVDGPGIARQVRAQGSTVPILVLTARADEVDLVTGLTAGADDYVTKPFRLSELLGRVRDLLERRASATTAEGLAS